MNFFPDMSEENVVLEYLWDGSPGLVVILSCFSWFSVGMWIGWDGLLFGYGAFAVAHVVDFLVFYWRRRRGISKKDKFDSILGGNK